MVVVGLNVLPYLGAVSGALRVWYAADEWAWHHLSQVRLLRPSTWGNIKQAAVKGLYERAYAPLLDRVWVVIRGGPPGHAVGRRASRAWTCCPTAWTPITSRRGTATSSRTSCVFWGRLDFGPNVQALGMVLRPRLAAACGGHARTRGSPIYGFQPTPRA